MSGEAQPASSSDDAVRNQVYEGFCPSISAKQRQTILEVGCGSGELAASLSSDGLAVVAIDSDGDSVAAAQQLGVDARLADWPVFEEGEFDAILFTRSLHHIHPLDEAVERAGESLVADGRIIAEDFAYEAADEETLRWFASVIDALDAAGRLVKDNDFLNSARSTMDSLTAWREDYEPEIHTGTDIAARIKNVFGSVTREDAPYFFGISPGRLSRAQSRCGLGKVAMQENALIAKREIAALGRRLVATRR